MLDFLKMHGMADSSAGAHERSPKTKTGVRTWRRVV
jgi:hypothetical protein